MTAFPLASVTCYRCWRPLAHCACEPAEAHEGDVVWLARAYPGLTALRTRVSAGAYDGAADTSCPQQQRWAFLLWRLDHGLVEEIGDLEDVGDMADSAAAIAGENAAATVSFFSDDSGA